MGILTADDGLVDAALSEILALPIEQKHRLDPERHVDYLLIQHHLAQVSSNLFSCMMLCISFFLLLLLHIFIFWRRSTFQVAVCALSCVPTFIACVRESSVRRTGALSRDLALCIVEYSLRIPLHATIIYCP